MCIELPLLRLVLTAPVALQGPEREYDVPLDRQNEQAEDGTPTLYPAKGELEAQIRREHGERRTVAQQPMWFTPELGFNGDRGGGDTFQDVMQEDQKLPGTLCIAMSGTNCRNDPTGKCFRRPRCMLVSIPQSSSLLLSREYRRRWKRGVRTGRGTERCVSMS